MKKLFQTIRLFSATILLIACGGGGSGNTQSSTQVTGNTEPNNSESEPFNKNVVGIAQFGLLQNAKIIIQKIPLGGGKLEVVFKENTTGGDLKHAGRFNTHSSELEDKVYYWYAVEGGKDIDSDSDGIANSPYDNKYNVSGAIVRGEWLKKLGNEAFRITSLSTDILISSLIHNSAGYSITKTALDKSTSKVLKSDINGDGKIDIKDILVYNPLLHRNHLKKFYTDLIEKENIFVQKHKSDYELEHYEKISTFSSDEGKYAVNYLLSKDEKKVYAANSKYFYIYDISSPYDISEIGALEIDFEDFAISKNEKYVFATTIHGIEVLNIEDPSNPISINSFNEENIDHDYIILSNDSTKAYVTQKRNDGNFLRILDIRDPLNINVIGEAELTAYGNIYASEDESEIYIDSTFKNEIEILDVTFPSNPKSVEVIDGLSASGWFESYPKLRTADKKYLFNYKNSTITLYKRK